MSLMNATETILIVIFFVATMISVGMETRLSDLGSLIASRGLLARTLVSNFLVVPILGVVLVLLLPLQPHVAGALVLLACTPGGLTAIQFTRQAKGSAPLAGATLGLLSLAAVFVSPLLLRQILSGDMQLVIPRGSALLFWLVFLALPLLVGMILVAKAPGAATKMSTLLGMLGALSFVAFMVVTGDARQAATGEIGTPAVGAMLLFIAVSMAVGWFMGGPAREARQVLATSTSMRNVALCVAIVQGSAPGHAVMVPLVAFSLLMVPTNMLFTVYHSVQAKRKARTGV